MAASARPGLPIDVCMTGGHGEWFFQSFSAQLVPLSPLASLHPDEARGRCTAPLVAGSQALALGALRPDAIALDILPDARRSVLLAPTAFHSDPRPSYGRAPDAKLPAQVQ